MDTFELTGTDPAAQERQWRDYAMTLLWVSTGTRSIELARAQRRHLAQRDGHPILYLHRKGGDAAEQPVVLAPWVLEALTAYFQIHDQRTPCDCGSLRALSRPAPRASALLLVAGAGEVPFEDEQCR